MRQRKLGQAAKGWLLMVQITITMLSLLIYSTYSLFLFQKCLIIRNPFFRNNNRGIFFYFLAGRCAESCQLCIENGGRRESKGCVSTLETHWRIRRRRNTSVGRKREKKSPLDPFGSLRRGMRGNQTIERARWRRFLWDEEGKKLPAEEGNGRRWCCMMMQLGKFHVLRCLFTL